jgi:hypothetical protein
MHLELHLHLLSWYWSLVVKERGSPGEGEQGVVAR